MICAAVAWFRCACSRSLSSEGADALRTPGVYIAALSSACGRVYDAPMRLPHFGARRASEAHVPDAGEAQLIARLRAGEEAAFADLVEHHHARMVRVARAYVASDDVAAEVVQDTWIAVLTEIDRFEERSTLRTWMYRILTNLAKTRGVREHRILPFSSLGDPQEQGPSVPPERFQSDTDDKPDTWGMPPRPWQKPERRLLSLELRGEITRSISTLSESQRLVLTLHDLEGLDTAEICELLELTPGNVRVLLHRGRSRVRADLERYLDAADGV